MVFTRWAVSHILIYIKYNFMLILYFYVRFKFHKCISFYFVMSLGDKTYVEIQNYFNQLFKNIQFYILTYLFFY